MEALVLDNSTVVVSIRPYLLHVSLQMVQMTFQNNDVYMAVKVDRYQRNLLAEMWEVSAVCWEIGTLPL